MNKRMIIVGAAVAITAAAAIAGLTLGLASGTPAGGHPAVRPAASTSQSAAPPSRALADCTRLTNDELPWNAYELLVIREIRRLAGNGDATRAQVRYAEATIDGEIRNVCPQFSDLIGSYR